ncbi:MAG: Uncharacterised protein [Cellulomonadaceae bacterium TMED98]|nr:MAG: Uncharacterised protein [Cellulomonadaceae bacterium TMED98]
MLTLPAESDPPTPRQGIRNVRPDRIGHREARVSLEGANNVVRRVTSGLGVPESEPGDAVGVDVFGGSLQFSKDRDIVTSVFGGRV